MNYFVFVLKSALFDFSRNKGRTILTSLGILIGVLAVVLLVAFGLGLKKYIEDQFESLGTNILRVLPGKLIQNGSFRSGPGALGGIQFDERDIAKLSRIKEAEVVAPLYTKTTTLTKDGNDQISDIYMTAAGALGALNLNIDKGRLFTKQDNDRRAKVVVIGPKIATKIYGSPEVAVGRTLKVEDQNFKIIGVLQSKGGGGFGGPDLDSIIFMPYKTGYVFNTNKKFIAIILKATSKDSIPKLKQDITTTLLTRYKVDDFSILEPTDILNAIGSIFGIMNTVLVAIAAISLLVGGIGIMNIMYVTVTERIKEIGIRRAIGATRRDILYQFLIESVILSLFGGLTGLLLAYLIVLLIQRVFPAYINIQTVLLSLGVSSAIGIIFGVFPAKKAADLSPIDAIRYE